MERNPDKKKSSWLVISIVVVIVVVIVYFIYKTHFEQDDDEIIVDETDHDKILTCIHLPPHMKRKRIYDLMEDIYKKSDCPTQINLLLITTNNLDLMLKKHVTSYIHRNHLKRDQIQLIHTSDLKYVRVFDFAIPNFSDEKTEKIYAELERRRHLSETRMNKFITSSQQFIQPNKDNFLSLLFKCIKKHWKDEKYICTFSFPFLLERGWDTTLIESHNEGEILSWSPADTRSGNARFPIMRRNTEHTGSNELHNISGMQFPKNENDYNVPLWCLNPNNCFCEIGHMYVLLYRFEKTFGKMLSLYDKFKMAMKIWKMSGKVGIREKLMNFLNDDDTENTEMMGMMGNLAGKKVPEIIEKFDNKASDEFKSEYSITFSAVTSWECIGLTLTQMSNPDDIFMDEDALLFDMISTYKEDPVDLQQYLLDMTLMPQHIQSDALLQVDQKMKQAQKIQDFLSSSQKRIIMHPHSIVSRGLNIGTIPSRLSLCTYFLGTKFFNPLAMLGLQGKGLSLHKFSFYLNKMGLSQPTEESNVAKAFYGILWQKNNFTQEEVLKKYGSFSKQILELVI
jgi:hypothetical protein